VIDIELGEGVILGVTAMIHQAVARGFGEGGARLIMGMYKEATVERVHIRELERNCG